MRPLFRRQVAAMRRQVAVTRRLVGRQMAFVARCLALGQLSAGDALVDTLLLVVDTLLHLAGLRRRGLA